MKSFKIITLFPNFFESPLNSSLLSRALRADIIRVEIVDLRSYSLDKFRRCDDYPYGGGSGMILKPDPLFRALKAKSEKDTKVILTTPSGVLLNQEIVKRLSEYEDFCIICGHYEGVDQRVIDRFVDLEVSIGDYVLSCGEYAALIILDTIARYVPGFMSNPDSIKDESFERSLLEYPHYTRPRLFDGWEVPDILLSGDHEKIKRWRLEKSIEKTRRVRYDLYDRFIKMRDEK